MMGRETTSAHWKKHLMNEIDTSAINMDATCDELRDALARQQSLLLDMAKSSVMVGGATLDGELLPGSTGEAPNNTVIEAEIARLEKAIAEKSCD